MKCHECRDLLSPYIDNMTSDEENKRITVHLSACSSCYREMQEMKMMLEGLGFFKGEVVLPDGYAEALHEKLLAHKTSLWGKRQASLGQHAGGWIAASVAALALGAGIWMSSFVPYAQVADSLQKIAPAIFDRDQEKVKPDVEKLIAQTAKDLLEQRKVQNNGDQPVVTEQPQKVAVNEPAKVNSPGSKETPAGVTQPQPADTTPATPEAPKVAPVVAMKVTVENLDTAVQLIKSEGKSQNTMVATVTDQVYYPLTAGRNQIMSIQVPEAEVEEWTDWLSGLGEATPPSSRKDDLTKEYNQLNAKVTSLQQSLAASKDDEKIKTELIDSQKQLEAIKKRLEMVTINVTLHEDITP